MRLPRADDSSTILSRSCTMYFSIYSDTPLALSRLPFLLITASNEMFV